MNDIFTARISRMGEGNSFSLLVCPHPGGRGYLPWPGPDRGRGDQCTYSPPPPGQDGWGSTPRYLPPPPQTKDLLHGGPYASCVHAGGLYFPVLWVLFGGGNTWTPTIIIEFIWTSCTRRWWWHWNIVLLFLALFALFAWSATLRNIHYRRFVIVLVIAAINRPLGCFCLRNLPCPDDKGQTYVFCTVVSANNTKYI